MPGKTLVTKNRKPEIHSGFLITHIPQHLPWYFLASVFSMVTRSLRRFEILRDPAKRGHPSGEFFVLLYAPDTAGRRAVDFMIHQHQAKVAHVNNEEGKDLKERFRIKIADLRADFGIVLGPDHPSVQGTDLAQAPWSDPARTESPAITMEGDPFSEQEDTRSVHSDTLAGNQGGNRGDQAPGPCALSPHEGMRNTNEPAVRRSARQHVGRTPPEVIQIFSSDGEPSSEDDSQASQYEEVEGSSSDESMPPPASPTDSEEDVGERASASRSWCGHNGAAPANGRQRPNRAASPADSYGEAGSVVSFDSSTAASVARTTDAPCPTDHLWDALPSLEGPLAREQEEEQAAEQETTALEDLPMPDTVPLVAQHPPQAALPTALASMPSTRNRLQLVTSQPAYRGSPFQRKRTHLYPPTFAQHGVLLRERHYAQHMQEVQDAAAPSHPSRLAQEIFVQVWRLAEDRVSGRSPWYPVVARTQMSNKFLQDDHAKFLAGRSEVRGMVYNYRSAQRLTDDFCEWFGIQRMHASALLDLINSRYLQSEHRVVIAQASRTTYAEAFGTDTHAYEVAAQVMMMILDAIRFPASAEFDPDTYLSIQQFRWREWGSLLAQAFSERMNITIRPSRLCHEVSEYVHRLSLDAGRLFDKFTMRRVEAQLVAERAAAGSRFIGGALEADLERTDCLVRPLGILREEEDTPPSPNLRYTCWLPCRNLSSLDARRESHVLRAGTSALPGCRIRIRGRGTAGPLTQLQLETILGHVVNTMTPGMPIGNNRAFSRVVIARAQVRQAQPSQAEATGWTEVEFWFADRAQTALAHLTMWLWVPLLSLDDACHVELSDNCGFLHPLCTLVTRVPTLWGPTFTQGSFGCVGPTALPEFVRPLRELASAETEYLVGYASPVAAAAMLEQRILMKTNTRAGEAPVRASSLLPYASAFLPSVCPGCGLLGHDEDRCTDRDAHRLQQCGLCTAWGTRSSARHRETKCPIRTSYLDTTRELIDRVLQEWQRISIFAPPQRPFLRQMFASHGQDRRVWTPVPPTPANHRAFAQRARAQAAAEAAAHTTAASVPARARPPPLALNQDTHGLSSAAQAATPPATEPTLQEGPRALAPARVPTQPREQEVRAETAPGQAPHQRREAAPGSAELTLRRATPASARHASPSPAPAATTQDKGKGKAASPQAPEEPVWADYAWSDEEEDLTTLLAAFDAHEADEAQFVDPTMPGPSRRRGIRSATHGTPNGSPSGGEAQTGSKRSREQETARRGKSGRRSLPF